MFYFVVDIVQHIHLTHVWTKVWLFHYKPISSCIHSQIFWIVSLGAEGSEIRLRGMFERELVMFRVRETFIHPVFDKIRVRFGIISPIILMVVMVFGMMLVRVVLPMGHSGAHPPWESQGQSSCQFAYHIKIIANQYRIS